MSSDTPFDYLTRMGQRGIFCGYWDFDDRCNELLDDICNRTDLGPDVIEQFSVDESKLRRSDYEDGWRFCLFCAYHLVDIDRDIQNGKLYLVARYPTMTRYKTHGFKPKPTVRQTRAINLED